MATTHPMKNPTAREEWNFRIIMVPPTLRPQSMSPDHKAASPSENRRDPRMSIPKIVRKSVIPRMEYLK